MSRQLRRFSALPAVLLALLSLPAHADQVEQHGNLVQKYITEQHANPLVADCAAHANFVVSTSTYYDRADFPPDTLDDEHAKTQPWNDSFDNGKQRIKVDTIVTITGQGYRKDANSTAEPLTFKCGYVDNKMLAFSYDDPGAPAAAQVSSRHHGKAGKNGRHSKKGHAGKVSAGKRGTSHSKTSHGGKTAKTGKTVAKRKTAAKKTTQ
jgi:hypothetical protein